jgi:colicin import membrane protein
MITRTAVLYSGLIHAVIAVVLIIGMPVDNRQQRVANSERSVKAVIVKEDLLVAEVRRIKDVENREKREKERELNALKKQLIELKNKSKNERNVIEVLQSEKNQIAKESQQAQKRRKVELEKAAEARQKAVEENIRLEKAAKARQKAESLREFSERKAAKAQRVLAEMELLAEISSEETSEEFVKQSVQDAELIDKYAAAIKTKVIENYKILAGQEGLECTLRITLIRDGNVAGVEVIKSSNNASFDRLAEVAVRKVAPFPVPEDERIFNKMRVISFVFRP